VVGAFWGGSLLVTPPGRRLNGVAELQSLLDDVRAQGFAENWEDTAEGLYAASVAVVNDEGVALAALTALIPICRIHPERREVVLSDLGRLGGELSALVHWLPAFSSRRP
jgi:DNA-binding IclR family transcriptional regulator